jgi:branched-chain amino acid transport system ATP-binding protein
MSDKKIRLSVKSVNKCFGCLQALADVGLQIEEGSIYGLIGPNGIDNHIAGLAPFR